MRRTAWGGRQWHFTAATLVSLASAADELAWFDLVHTLTAAAAAAIDAVFVGRCGAARVW